VRQRASRGHLSPSAAREAAGVALICLGAVTLLALASYQPTDISLNASGSAEVANWIGPAGAYWADLLLQGLGVGAWALGALFLLAGCRAFAGRAIVPGPREAVGGALLMLASGTLSQLVWGKHEFAFAPGGVAGALLAVALLQNFAGLGAFLLATSLLLVALAMTAEGILSGWGYVGVSVARTTWRHSRALAGHGRRQVGAAWADARARRLQLRAERRAAAAELAAAAPLQIAGAAGSLQPGDAVLGAAGAARTAVADATYGLWPQSGEEGAEQADMQPASEFGEAPLELAAGGFAADQGTTYGERAALTPESGSDALTAASDIAAAAAVTASAAAELSAAASELSEDLVAAGSTASAGAANASAVADSADAADTDDDFVFFENDAELSASKPEPTGVLADAASAAASSPVARLAAVRAAALARRTAQSPLPAVQPPPQMLEPEAPGVADAPPADVKPAVDAGARADLPPAQAQPAAPSPAPAATGATPQTAAARIAAAAARPPIVDVRPQVDAAAIAGAAAQVPTAAKAQQYNLPPKSLLDFVAAPRAPIDPARLQENAEKLTRTLMDYGIDGHVREIRPGPVVTMYEYVPAPGIKLAKIASLADDLDMSMEAMRVRIVAPIPGKGAVGIEIPNDNRETVYLKEIIAHSAFNSAQSPLAMALGKDIEGNAYVADLARMPHLLVAGATGAGKSVSINAMIMSVLFKATPDEVRMLMVDPKMLELSVYEGIPHLLLPVVTDPKKAALALRWATDEMERRYELLAEVGVRGIDAYNVKVRAAAARGKPLTVAGPQPDSPRRPCTPMPYLLVVVDELADLMMVASREVEASIMRLAQMARAAGIHLILATQRPSVDVLTGVIKANFPTRIAFQVASRHDSRTIIDGNGAEHLLGRGDMLYLSPGVGGIKRVHGAFVSDEEIERTVAFVRSQGTPQYDESILTSRVEEGDAAERVEQLRDEMYDQAVAVVAESQQASISMIQRRLRIGYNRAARMVERMELEGVVGPADGVKPREVLISATTP
jgi:S-DNA-T family DNA segregation ATPase FtsK/SpoIIIE